MKEFKFVKLTNDEYYKLLANKMEKLDKKGECIEHKLKSCYLCMPIKKKKKKVDGSIKV